MILAPSKHSTSLLVHDVPRNSNGERTSPLNPIPMPATPAGERTSRRASLESSGVDYRNSACSLDDVDVDMDEFTSAFLRGDGEFNGVTPSGSSNVLGSGSRNGAQASTPKRKQPHLFKQLANEFRWMHNNLKNGYNSGYSAGSNLATPQTTREDYGAPEEDDAPQSATRGSLRRHTRTQSSPTSARDPVKGGVASPDRAGKSPQKLRWRTLENGEVEAVEPLKQPQSTPDPFAPQECRYVVRHPPLDATDAKEVREDSQRAPCPTSLHHPRHSHAEPGKSTSEPVTLADSYLSDSLLSDSDDSDDDLRSDSPAAARCTDNESSDVEAVANVAACPSDRRLAKVRHASTGILEDVDDADDFGATAMCPDGYDAFLCVVAHLQRQLHQLNQHTIELRRLYVREQNARLRSKGKGQHLSWTRTVEAANTIQFWRMKVNLLRTFESQYVNAVQELQERLPLYDPESADLATYPTASKKADVTARRAFLTSPKAIVAQQQHLKALGEEFHACWQANANLRDELRQFEQWEVRTPHDTFSVAGMDAEHFIASLPPRISAYSLYGASAKSSAMSLDSMNDDDDAAPLLLLTAQNLSPMSDDDDDQDNFHIALHRPHRKTDSGAPQIRATCGGGNAPLVSCLKGHDTVAAETSPATSLPSSPKRLKYVIQSASFGAEDADGTSTSINNQHLSASNLSNGRHSNRGSFTSRGSTPPTGNLSYSVEAQARRKRERHVTFALEPEVLDARPRFSAHGRTVELLEQICMDKQAPWNGATLLQTALDERQTQLTLMLDRMEDAQREMLERAVTMTPVCANAPTFRCDSELRAPRSRPETAPSPTLTCVSASTSFSKASATKKRSKVKPKECAQCAIM